MIKPAYIPTKEIVKTLLPFSKKKILLPSIILSIDVLLYISCLMVLIHTSSLYIKSILAILIAFIIAMIFTIGHDCCHHSFTSSKKLNKIFGRIAFSFSLHNFSLWNLGHNETHHSFTNLKNKDYVYAPLSKCEYQALSMPKQQIYKLYRSIFGHCPYYLIEIWFKKILYPFKKISGINSAIKTTALLDLIPIAIYLFGLTSLIIIRSQELNQSAIINFTFAMIIPFLVWNWIMGFVIFQHHTNPFTRWYLDKVEWEYWEVQLEHSTHIRFPKPINFITHNIMEHSAHHGNMQIPMYELKNAQKALESKFKDRMQIINWSFKFYWDSIQTCKLYDYEKHSWLDFK